MPDESSGPPPPPSDDYNAEDPDSSKKLRAAPKIELDLKLAYLRMIISKYQGELRKLSKNEGKDDAGSPENEAAIRKIEKQIDSVKKRIRLINRELARREEAEDQERSRRRRPRGSTSTSGNNNSNKNKNSSSSRMIIISKWSSLY